MNSSSDAQTSTNTFPWSFFALTFVLSWLFWIPAALSRQNATQTTWLIPFMLGGFGPSVAGIILTYRNKNKQYRRDFWKRVVDFRRISAGWYAFIFLVFPAVIGISFLIYRVLGNPRPELETLAQIGANPLMLVGMIVIGIITGPLSEELGWRGFALDQLQKRWSPLLSSLILAPFWWAWHLPLFFIAGTSQHDWGIGTPSFWLFMMGIVPLSILLTWVYNHSNRSILAAVLLHFTYNFTLNVAHPLPTSVKLIHVILLVITAVGIILRTKPRD